MDKTEYKVETLVDMIERGELSLPEMQRGYVWGAPRVRDLLDSLYRGYPSGAILIWETGDKVPTRSFAVQSNESMSASRKLLLDGQQRLTSLSAVIRGQPLYVAGRKRPIDILFNLDHPESLTIFSEVDEKATEDIDPESGDASADELAQRLEKMVFVVSTNKLVSSRHWINVSEVFRNSDNASFLQRAGVISFDDPKFQKYNERLNRLREIRRYVYRVDLLDRTMDYQEVTEIFVRVNSLGAKLRSSDLALAQITAKWQNSLSDFEDFREEVKRFGFDLDLGIHLKALVAFATGQSRFKTVHALSVETLRTAWEQAKEGMRFATDWAKNNLKIDSEELLSSPFLLITIAYFGHKADSRISGEEAKQLRQYALLANAKGRYSRGSTETFLDQDLAAIDRDGGVSELMRLLRGQMGRLSVEPGDLEGRNARSGLFKTMFLAFKARGARDWYSNLEISLNHQGRKHKLQFHHFFPQDLVKNRYPSLVNDICNYAFIGSRTNQNLSAKPPHEYVPVIVERQGGELLHAQCLPSDGSDLTVDRYEEFLQKRRQWVAKELNTFFGLDEGSEAI